MLVKILLHPVRVKLLCKYIILLSFCVEGPEFYLIVLSVFTSKLTSYYPEA
jgi:hypothetical protein